MASVNPYLTFDGNCLEAFNFYKAAFGGDFEMVMRFSDMPKDAGQPGMEINPDLIMHISMPIGGGTAIMGSDRPAYMGSSTVGDNFSVSADTKEQADQLYKDLSAGGNPSMPMMDMFWGSYFGMLTDKYGIQWMISYANRQN